MPVNFKEAPVTNQFARQKEAMVYGRYKDQGYQVNPISAQAGATTAPANYSVAESFRIAGADFQVHLGKLSMDGVEIQSHKTVYRDDIPLHLGGFLGVVGKDWVPVQNDALIQLFQSLDGLVTLDNILVLGNGKKVFATASLDATAEVADGHQIKRYIHAYNDHSGNGSFGLHFSDTNLICANQLNFLTGKDARLAGASGTRHSHTKGVTAFAANLPRLIDFQNQKFYSSIDELNHMKSQELSVEFTRNVLEKLYASELSRPVKTKDGDVKIERQRTLDDLKAAGRIQELMTTGYGMDAKGVRGTRYQLFQAITQHCTHDTFKNADEREQGMAVSTARARLESLWSGGAQAKRINHARALCLA